MAPEQIQEQRRQEYFAAKLTYNAAKDRAESAARVADAAASLLHAARAALVESGFDLKNLPPAQPEIYVPPTVGRG